MQAKWYDPPALVIYGILGAIGAGVVYSLYRIPKDVMDAQALLNPSKGTGKLDRFVLPKGTLLYHGTPYPGIRMLQPESWLAFDEGTAWGWADPREWIEYSEPVKARVLVFEVKEDLELPIVGDDVVSSGQAHYHASSTCGRERGWVVPPASKNEKGEIMLCQPHRWLRYKRTLKS